MNDLAYSDLSDAAQRRAAKLSDNGAVWARRNKRGWELTQINEVHGTFQYGKAEGELWKKGWQRIDFGS